MRGTRFFTRPFVRDEDDLFERVDDGGGRRRCDDERERRDDES